MTRQEFIEKHDLDPEQQVCLGLALKKGLFVRARDRLVDCRSGGGDLTKHSDDLKCGMEDDYVHAQLGDIGRTKASIRHTMEQSPTYFGSAGFDNATGSSTTAIDCFRDADNIEVMTNRGWVTVREAAKSPEEFDIWTKDSRV